jgi:hypothetical protein
VEQGREFDAWVEKDETEIDADMNLWRRLGVPKGRSKVFPIFVWLCLSLETLTYVPVK